jgi:hypothetical protein
MKNKMIDALIFESKGYFLKANEIYDEILTLDPQNETALAGKKRINEMITCNRAKLELFLSDDETDQIEFERWLTQI